MLPGEEKITEVRADYRGLYEAPEKQMRQGAEEPAEKQYAIRLAQAADPGFWESLGDGAPQEKDAVPSFGAPLPAFAPEEARPAPALAVLEAAHEQNGPEASPTAEARRCGRAHGALLLLVLLLALVGVAVLVAALGRSVLHTVPDDGRLRKWDPFVQPVVMQEPEPFSSPEAGLVLASSVWYAVSQQPELVPDASGTVPLPLGDVEIACRTLFGPSCALKPAAGAFFDYDAEDRLFAVTPGREAGCMAPYTESVRRSDGALVLTVGYVAPDDAWRAGKAERPKVTKRMEYVLKKAPETGQWYLSAVRAPEG